MMVVLERVKDVQAHASAFEVCWNFFYIYLRRVDDVALA